MVSGVLPKLSAKEESDICLSCGECCRKYWITVLPKEAKEISKTLKMTEKDFLKQKCVLFVKVFPKSTPGILTSPTTFFPRRLFDLLKKEIINVPQSFFIVPQVVLNREQNECTLLGENNACSSYRSRPKPCRLFPFIAVEGYREQYPFCGLFKKTFKNYSKQSKEYYKEIQKYFEQVNKKGFTSVWPNAPLKGVFFLNEEQLGEITLQELEQMLFTQPEKRVRKSKK